MSGLGTATKGKSKGGRQLIAKTLVPIISGLFITLSGVLGTAWADDGVAFGMRPARISVDQPGTLGYFNYSLAPGDAVQDDLLVVNSGVGPVLLKLYPADALSAVNGGVSFAQQSVDRKGVSGWLSLTATEVTLAPGEKRVVTFSIKVPKDALPGHHVGGLVAEAPPSAGSGEQFVVKTVRQVGLAVVVDVPGAHERGLEITGATLRQQGDEGATFSVTVHNTGNMFVKGHGSLLVDDWQGNELASVPLKMDTVLPGDTMTFQVTHPIRLADGRYSLKATLDYGGPRLALFGGAELKMADGKPQVGGQEAASVLPPFVSNLFPSQEKTAASNLPFLALVAVLALALLAGIVTIGKRLFER